MRNFHAPNIFPIKNNGKYSHNTRRFAIRPVFRNELQSDNWG